MNILVISGSPKGESSVTLQSVLFLQRCHPEVHWQIHHAGAWAVHGAKDETIFETLARELATADLVLWCYPLFYCLMPAQLQQFVEALQAHGLAARFVGKQASTLTTSVHYFDHLAHAYTQMLSEDLGMHYLPGHSAEMDDLLAPDGQRNLCTWFGEVMQAVAAKEILPRKYAPLSANVQAYAGGEPAPLPGTFAGKTVILTDAEESDTSLRNLINGFVRAWNAPVETLNLRQVEIKGGCLSCYHCGADNHCNYQDGFMELYERIRTAQVVVFAMRMQGRLFSSRWKCFFDRSFYHGHTPSLKGAQVAWLVAGPLRQSAPLQEFIESQTTNMGTAYAGVLTDEEANNNSIIRGLQILAARLRRAALGHYEPGETFLQTGAAKLFRDLVYKSRFIFRADHRYYKQNGFYDYPNQGLKRFTTWLLYAITAVPFIQKSFYREARTQMLRPYKKAIEQAGPPAKVS